MIIKPYVIYIYISSELSLKPFEVHYFVFLFYTVENLRAFIGNIFLLNSFFFYQKIIFCDKAKFFDLIDEMFLIKINHQQEY